MDLLTLFGAVFGVTAIVAGFSLEGGHFASLFQLEAFVIVLGGTLRRGDDPEHLGEVF